MSTKKTLLLILNCKKYRAKALVQKRTWLTQLPPHILYYHVIGDLALDTAFRLDDNERILYVKTADDYVSLPKKTIAALDAVNILFDYDYIYKTDDDQNVLNMKFFDMVQSFLERAPRPIHYGGQVVDVKSAHVSQYYKVHPELPRNLVIEPTQYCSGRFYLLSKKAVTHLLKKKEAFDSEYFEDYAVGKYLDPSLKGDVLNLKMDMFFKDLL
jgi:hypothetical protein